MRRLLRAPGNRDGSGRACVAGHLRAPPRVSPDGNAPGNIRDYVARINRIRRENRALHEYRNLAFHESSDEHVLCYGKRSVDGGSTVLIAVNLDPFTAHESEVRVPLETLGVAPDEPFQAHELISDERQLWRGPVQRIRLDPRREPAAIFRLERFAQHDYGTPCY